MSQPSLFDGTPVGDGWHYVEFADGRFRWKHDGETHAHDVVGFTIETYYPSRDEWRTVQNTGSKSWFTVGFLAAGGTLP